MSILAVSAMLALFQSASLEGVLYRFGTTEPISDARIELSEAVGEQLIASAFSAEDGAFVISDIPPGKYRLRATKMGTAFSPMEYGQRSPSGGGVVFRLDAGTRMNDVRLYMAPTGSISGRVLRFSANPTFLVCPSHQPRRLIHPRAGLFLKGLGRATIA